MIQLKSIVSLSLSVILTLGIFTGCGHKKKVVVLNEDGTSAIQSNTAIVAYNSVGYGHEWLETLAEEFNKMYAEEGYVIEVKISPDMMYENNPALEIGKGAERNDVESAVFPMQS